MILLIYTIELHELKHKKQEWFHTPKQCNKRIKKLLKVNNDNKKANLNTRYTNFIVTTQNIFKQDQKFEEYSNSIT